MERVCDDTVFEAIRARMESREHAGRCPVATAEAIEEVEETIGYPLPPLLRRLFLEVSNGGFGPGHGGILGAPDPEGPSLHSDWADLVDVHQAFGSDPDPQVPRHMLWLHDWGCSARGFPSRSGSRPGCRAGCASPVPLTTCFPTFAASSLCSTIHRAGFRPRPRHRAPDGAEPDRIYPVNHLTPRPARALCPGPASWRSVWCGSRGPSTARKRRRPGSADDDAR